MIRSSLSKLRLKFNKLGSALTLLSLGGTSLVLTSCTTEEGVIAGALAGAAIGGIVGHSQESNHRRSKRHYQNNNSYHEAPRRSGYRYSSYESNGYAADPYCYY